MIRRLPLLLLVSLLTLALSACIPRRGRSNDDDDDSAQGDDDDTAGDDDDATGDDDDDATGDDDDSTPVGDDDDATPSDEDCTDGVDNDGDGRTDCSDSDCQGHDACLEDCDDGVDNDADGRTDCDDSDCEGSADCVEDCDDGRDNDGDGYIDCVDFDCDDDPDCQEDCDDGRDNDGDGYIDCNDFDCDDDPACEEASGLFAADGRSATSGNLYRIDPSTGAPTVVGPIGFPITAMAFAPGGTLFGVEAVSFAHAARLIRIDTDTGAGTVVAELHNSTTGAELQPVPDITFAGDRLIGWSEINDEAIFIDTSTGDTTDPSGGSTSSYGSGMATVDGVVYFAPGGALGGLYTINTATGAATEVGTLSGVGSGDAINAMASVGGVLYGSIKDGAGDDNLLVRINPTSGSITTIGPIPIGIDALAGR